CRDRIARTEDHVVEHAAVLAQRLFVVGAAVDVVEDDAGQARSCEAPEIGDVDGAVDSHPWRTNGARFPPCGPIADARPAEWIADRVRRRALAGAAARRGDRARVG